MADKKPCGGCGDSPTPNAASAILEAQPHSDVVASYGLCLENDEFIIDKAIWVVDLKDGTKIFQDDDRPGVKIASAWRRLGYYMQDHPHNPIVAMRLRFGTHAVPLPSDKDFYFYSKGMLQALTQTHGLDFHIVGWPNDEGGVTCVWYKVPELIITQQTPRPLSDCMPDQLIGKVPG